MRLLPGPWPSSRTARVSWSPPPWSPQHESLIHSPVQLLHRPFVGRWIWTPGTHRSCPVLERLTDSSTLTRETSALTSTIQVRSLRVGTDGPKTTRQRVTATIPLQSLPGAKDCSKLFAGMTPGSLMSSQRRSPFADEETETPVAKTLQDPTQGGGKSGCKSPGFTCTGPASDAYLTCVCGGGGEGKEKCS